MAYILLPPAKYVVKKLINRYSCPHVEIPPETIDLIQRKRSGILYVAPHKSLWETGGIPWAINNYVNDTPHIVAADTLFGKAFHPLFRQLKVIIHKRGESLQLKEDMKKALVKDNVLLFAEGSRTRKGSAQDFFSAGLQAPIDLSLDYEAYIVLANVDYDFVNEEKRLLGKKKQHHYKFYAHHMVEWLRNIGDVYISFSQPIKIQSGNDRKILSDVCKTGCLDLVKILPVNIVAEAINRNSQCDKTSLTKTLAEVIEELSPYAKRFRGFGLETPLEVIIKRSGLNLQQSPRTKLYAGYIAHYLK